MTDTSTTPRPFTSVWSDLQEVEFSQGFVQAGPYRTRYLHAGDTSKPTLVMLHGITGHAEAYARNLRSHAEHFSCWAIDFIGHGYSDKPDHPLEVKHYIDQVIAFLDAIGVQKASFTGESLGGWVTAQLAIDHPDRVERIVLNTMGGTMANPQVMERLYMLSMEAAKDPSWDRVKARLEWLMADPSMVTDDLIKTRQAIFQQSDWLRACEANMALQDPEIRRRNMLTDDALGRIQAPAMVLWTTKDPSGPVTEARTDHLVDPRRPARGDGELRPLAAIRGHRDLRPDPPGLPARPLTSDFCATTFTPQLVSNPDTNRFYRRGSTMTPNTPAVHSTSGSRPFDTDVLILGTGPVGLTLANLLGGYGIRTTIADAGSALIDYPRGVGLDDESLRTFQAAGVVEQVLPHTTPQPHHANGQRQGTGAGQRRARCPGFRLVTAERVHPAVGGRGTPRRTVPVRPCTTSISRTRCSDMPTTQRRRHGHLRTGRRHPEVHPRAVSGRL